MGAGEAWNKLMVLSLGSCPTTACGTGLLVTKEAEKPVIHGDSVLVSTHVRATASLGNTA